VSLLQNILIVKQEDVVNRRRLPLLPMLPVIVGVGGGGGGGGRSMELIQRLHEVRGDLHVVFQHQRELRL
jgi:hypothetical protein